MTGRRHAHGRWTFDEQALALDYHDTAGRWLYEVDLKRCRTAAGMLDMIMQVAGKTWATDDVIAGLVRELDRLLAPQATLCSFGYDRGPLDVQAAVANVAEMRKLAAQLAESRSLR
jgi:hypothetical protein